MGMAVVRRPSRVWCGRICICICATQERGGQGRADEEHLWNYPHALGIRSALLDVPSMTGCCTIMVDGKVRRGVGKSVH